MPFKRYNIFYNLRLSVKPQLAPAPFINIYVLKVQHASVINDNFKFKYRILMIIKNIYKIALLFVFLFLTLTYSASPGFVYTYHIEPSENIYIIRSLIEYDYSVLYKIRQPQPEVIKFILEIEDAKGTIQTRKVLIRSLNDCPTLLKDSNCNMSSFNFISVLKPLLSEWSILTNSASGRHITI